MRHKRPKVSTNIIEILKNKEGVYQCSTCDMWYCDADYHRYCGMKSYVEIDKDWLRNYKSEYPNDCFWCIRRLYLDSSTYKYSKEKQD